MKIGSRWASLIAVLLIGCGGGGSEGPGSDVIDAATLADSAQSTRVASGDAAPSDAASGARADGALDGGPDFDGEARLDATVDAQSSDASANDAFAESSTHAGGGETCTAGEACPFGAGISATLGGDAGVVTVLTVPQPTLPGGYSAPSGVPAVQIGASGVALPGFVTVTINLPPSDAGAGAYSSITVISVGGVTPTGVLSTVTGSTVTFQTNVGGTYVVVAPNLTPPSTCSPKVASGGTFNMAELAGLAGVTTVSGDFLIDGSDVTSLANLTCLVEVTGTFQIVNTSVMTLAGLEHLHVIGNSFNVSSNGSLTNLDALAGLLEIGGNLTVNSNGGLLTADGLANVIKLGGAFDVESNASMTSMKASALPSVNGAFTFRQNGGYNSQPLSLDLGALTVIHGDVLLYDNPTWQLGAGFTALQTIQGALQISSNAALSALDELTSLVTIGTSLTINSNGSLLTANGFANVASLGSTFDVESNSSMTSMKWSSLPSVNGSFTFRQNGGYNSQPLSLDLGSLTIIHGDVLLYDNPTWQLGTGFASLQTIQGALQISSNAGLTALDGLTSLKSIGSSLTINSNGSLLTANGFVNVTSLGSTFDVESNGSLTSMKWSSLPTVSGSFTFRQNGGATSAALSLDLGALTIIHGDVLLYDNPTWQLGAGLVSLQTVQGALQISSNAGLTDLNQLSSLATVSGALTINSNAALGNLDHLTALKTLASSVTIDSNGSLVTANGFANVTSLGSTFDVESNGSLTSMNWSSLPSVNGGFTFRQNGGVPSGALSLNLGALTIIHGDVLFYDNPTWQLGTGLASLQTIQGALQISSNAGLANLDQLTSLTTIGSSVTIDSNAALATANGFANVTALGSTFDVESNGSLTSMKWSSLASVNGSFTFRQNGGTTSAALSLDCGALTIIHGDVLLYANSTLQLGAGLASLRTIQGALQISSNAALSALSLPSLTSIGTSLNITSNAALPTCQATAVVTQLTPTVTSTISGNLSDTCGS